MQVAQHVLPSDNGNLTVDCEPNPAAAHAVVWMLRDHILPLSERLMCGQIVGCAALALSSLLFVSVIFLYISTSVHLSLHIYISASLSTEDLVSCSFSDSFSTQDFKICSSHADSLHDSLSTFTTLGSELWICSTVLHLQERHLARWKRY